MTENNSIYREESEVKISGIHFRFIHSGISQLGLIQKLITVGVSGMFLTPEQSRNLTEEKVFEKCLKELARIYNLPESQDKDKKQAEVFSRMLIIPEAAIIFNQLVFESFPDIKDPWLLTDEAKSEILALLMEKLATNFQVAAMMK